jgi:hypothetical protein
MEAQDQPFVSQSAACLLMNDALSRLLWPKTGVLSFLPPNHEECRSVVAPFM